MSGRSWLGRVLWIVGSVGLLTGAGCAGSKEMVVDLYGTVVYEKPEIRTVSHRLDDSRQSGGSAMVQVSIEGDPGLEATFDIYPGVVERHPMTEGAAGVYTGSFEFPPDDVGGAFTVTGRLEHEKAGEVVLRDPLPLTVPRINGR